MYSDKFLVSVVIPVYNVENVLEKCINSVLSQTYKNLQIILVDDGSTDNSGNICDAFCKKDDRVAVIHKKNGGLSDARNVGLKQVSGDYISFIDSDDWVSEDFIETLIDNAVSHQADISIVDYAMVFESGKIKYVNNNYKELEIFNTREALQQLLIQNISFMVCNKLYKKEIFDNVEFPVGQLYEDASIGLKTFLKTKKVVICHKAKYFYFQREGSIVNSVFTEKKLSLIDTCNEILRYSSDNGVFFYESHALKIRCLISFIMQSYLTNKEYTKMLKESLKNERKYLLNNKYLDIRKKIAGELIINNFPLSILAKMWKNRIDN